MRLSSLPSHKLAVIQSIVRTWFSQGLIAQFSHDRTSSVLDRAWVVLPSYQFRFADHFRIVDFCLTRIIQTFRRLHRRDSNGAEVCASVFKRHINFLKQLDQLLYQVSLLIYYHPRLQDQCIIVGQNMIFKIQRPGGHYATTQEEEKGILNGCIVYEIVMLIIAGPVVRNT